MVPPVISRPPPAPSQENLMADVPAKPDTELKPATNGSVPEAPAHLADAGRERWVEVLDSVAGRTWIAETDLGQLTRYCELMDTWAALQQVAASSPPIVEGSKGQPVPNPVTKELLSVARELRAIESEFALSPAARMRLEVGAVKVEATKTALEELLDRRQSNQPVQVIVQPDE